VKLTLIGSGIHVIVLHQYNRKETPLLKLWRSVSLVFKKTFAATATPF